MRKNLVSTVLRTSAFATACLALAGSNVLAVNTPPAAAPVMTAPASGTETYSASGSIGDTGISSPGGATPSNVISYSFGNAGSGGSSLTYIGTSAITLGQFQVATLAAGQETDYKNTPFSITYNPVSYSNGTSNLAYPTSTVPITISGFLNGAITGSASSVVATFTSVSNPAFASPDGSTLSTISIANNPLNLVAPSAGGTTSVQALVSSTSPAPAGGGGTNPPSTPEPTTFAILATALVGLGLRKQLRKARLAD
jgi:hypothetical protein